MSSPVAPRSGRHNLASPLWVLAFVVALALPLGSLAVAVAAISTTYKDSARWKKALIVAAGVLVLAWQLSVFLPTHTSFHEGPVRSVPVG